MGARLMVFTIHVSHSKLLWKLRCFSRNLLAWLESYLHDRMQRVTTYGEISQALPVTPGVPQWSILGPLLFLLYVNSLPGNVRSRHVVAFAYDTRVFKSIKSPTDVALSQDDLSRPLLGCCSTNQSAWHSELLRNTTLYHINKIPLGITSAEKDFGVVISDKLSWNKQVCDQCTKSDIMLEFVRHLNTRSITNVRHAIYLTLVKSHLGYATQVWAPQSKEKTEQIQRRATKYILSLPSHCEESYKDRLINLDLLLMSYFPKYVDTVFFFKSVTGLVKVNPTVIPANRVPSRATRSSCNTNVTLFIPRMCKTTTYQRSFLIRLLRIWNAQADDIGLSVTYYKHSFCKSYDPEDPRLFKLLIF